MKHAEKIRKRAGAPAASGRYVVISALLLALLVAPFAGASGEGEPDRGRRAQPQHNKSAALHRRDPDPDRERHLRHPPVQQEGGDGGGAIYGCRSAPGREPCIRANNLENGRAFEFQATSGTEGGFIEVGKGSPNTKAVPFNTNASARVANLNADRVDDLHASRHRRAGQGPVGGGRSGRRPVAQERRDRSSSKLGTGEYEVVFGRDVTACAYNVTLGSTDTTEAPAGEAGASQRAGNAKAVAVVTRDSNGAKADRPFHLTVNC